MRQIKPAQHYNTYTYLLIRGLRPQPPKVTQFPLPVTSQCDPAKTDIKMVLRQHKADPRPAAAGCGWIAHLGRLGKPLSSYGQLCTVEHCLGLRTTSTATLWRDRPVPNTRLQRDHSVPSHKGDGDVAGAKFGPESTRGIKAPI